MPDRAGVRLDVPLLVVGAVRSTNDVARAEGRARVTELVPLGGVPALAVLATEQTAGRGRAGRAWSSPPGTGLYLSIYLRPAWPPARAAWLTLAAALAVRDACAAMLAPCTSGPPLLKWPNDLLSADDPARKVGGILVETRTQHGTVDEAVIGIGLNLAPPVGGFAGAVAATAGALVPDPLSAPDAGALARVILDALAREVLALGGAPEAAAASLVTRARAASPLWGRTVRFERGGREARGVARTWADDGGLEIELDGGARVVVHAGDVAVEWGARP
ncbi:MAG: biotin--[acetyl-CoA-carboxylase] ligase [Candidatus Eisenbacteria bacterium]